VIWLRARLLQPWRQLLSMAHAVSQRDFTQRAHISGRNEMAKLGMALNNMSSELAQSYAVLEQRVKEKTAGLEQKNEILSFLWQANRRLHMQVPLCERLSPVLNGLQNLTLLHDIELRVYDLEDEDNRQEFTCQPDMTCDDIGCHLCPRGILPTAGGGTTLKWRLADNHMQYGLLLGTLRAGACRAASEPRSTAAGRYPGRAAYRYPGAGSPSGAPAAADGDGGARHHCPRAARLYRSVALLYEDAGQLPADAGRKPARLQPAAAGADP